jgi:hypothetical protein
MEDGTFKVTCVDFFVMDIGTAGFTQYDESVEVVDYMCQHPELLENGVYQGLIHSHNNMATFFSGTDTATLLSEGQDTVHFVSLIVNNAGKYTAGVTRRVTMETKAEGTIKYTKDARYKTYQDGVVTLAAAQSEEKKVSQVQKDEYIEWFGLTIEKAEVSNDFEEVDQRTKTEIPKTEKQLNRIYSLAGKLEKLTISKEDKEFLITMMMNYRKVINLGKRISDFEYLSRDVIKFDRLIKKLKLDLS